MVVHIFGICSGMVMSQDPMWPKAKQIKPTNMFSAAPSGQLRIGKSIVKQNLAVFHVPRTLGSSGLEVHCL